MLSKKQLQFAEKHLKGLSYGEFKEKYYDKAKDKIKLLEAWGTVNKRQDTTKAHKTPQKPEISVSRPPMFGDKDELVDPVKEFTKVEEEVKKIDKTIKK